MRICEPAERTLVHARLWANVVESNMEKKEPARCTGNELIDFLSRPSEYENKFGKFWSGSIFISVDEN